MSSTGGAEPAGAAARAGTATQRLFLALWPGAALRASLTALRDLQPWPQRAAPVASERLHLTLHFLGEVPAARVPPLQAALAVPLARFVLPLDCVACWAGGLVVLEASRPPPALLALHAALADALRAAGLPASGRALRPHVTLARHAVGHRPRAPARALRWPVTGFELVRSRLGPVPRYERLWRRAAA